MIKEIKFFCITGGKGRYISKIVEDGRPVVGKLYKGFIDEDKSKMVAQKPKTLVKK